MTHKILNLIFVILGVLGIVIGIVYNSAFCIIINTISTTMNASSLIFGNND